MKVYSNTECRDFLKSLELYRVTKTLSNKEVVSYIDFDEYLADQKVVARRDGDASPAVIEQRMGLYLELTDKWDQACRYQNRVLFAKKADMDALQASL